MEKLTIKYLIIIVVLFYPLKTQVKIDGYIEEKTKIIKQYQGGVHIRFNIFLENGNVSPNSKVILDDKYIFFSNQDGQLDILLSKSSCISIKAFDLNVQRFQTDSLCLDSNTYIEFNMHLGDVYLD